MFLLLSCWILAGIMAEDPTVTHYQLKNSSVCLHVREPPPPYNGDKWTVAKTVIASGESINPNYTGRVDYNPKNLTLCIKWLTDRDTGIYNVEFHDPQFKSFKKSHKVVVQGIVPRPVILMSVLHSNLSAGSCSIKVNCSIQGDWLLSDCDEVSCRASEKSFSKVNITISADNRTVVCGGNNHVSTNNVSKSMATICFSKSDREHKEASQSPFVIVIVLAVCISLCAFFAVMAKRLSSEYNCYQEPASTAQLIESQPAETQPQPEPRVSTSSSSQGDNAYENVDVTQPSQTSSLREELGSMPSQTVDTVYSVIQVQNMAPHCKSGSSKDGHTMAREASTSQPVNGAEAESTMQIDTVYSLLQKPKKNLR